MIADVVVAAVTPDVLREALPAIHRSGLGHTARVMRAERGDLRAQLRRAGVPVESGPERLASEELLLMVAAAGRSPVAASLLLDRGARATWIVSPSGYWRQVDDVVVPSRPEDRPTIPSVVPGAVPPTVMPSAVSEETPPA
jgi:hypothetical protein